MTEKLPAKLLAALSERYPEATWTRKDGAPEMILLGFLLEQADILEADRFKRYSTTLGPRIYFSFDPTVDEDPARCSTIGHEFHHVQQWTERGELYVVEYLTDEMRRAEYEAEAFAVGAEIRVMLGLPVPTSLEYASRLAAYGCSAEAIAHCEKLLSLQMARILKGAVGSTVGKVARECLLSN